MSIHLWGFQLRETIFEKANHREYPRGWVQKYRLPQNPMIHSIFQALIGAKDIPSGYVSAPWLENSPIPRISRVSQLTPSRGRRFHFFAGTLISFCRAAFCSSAWSFFARLLKKWWVMGRHITYIHNINKYIYIYMYVSFMYPCGEIFGLWFGWLWESN